MRDQKLIAWFVSKVAMTAKIIFFCRIC